MTADRSRRAFLAAAAAATALPAAAAATALPAAAAAAASARREDDAAPATRPAAAPAATQPAPLFRISLAQWSLNRAFFGGTLDAMDFASIARTQCGIDAVEYVNSFYRDRVDRPGFAAELRRRADDAGARSLLIMVDGEGALGDADESGRNRAVANHRRWLELAQALGCHAIRVNAQSSGTREEQRDRAADGLSRLVALAEPMKLNVLVENHGGLSSDGAWLAEVMRRVNHPRCGTLPDFGNFRVAADRDYDRYRGVAELMPFAKAVSAKSRAFDAEGNERETDYRRMLRIVLDAGYRGWIGVEWEGEGMTELEGIAATKRLLERVRAEIAAS